MMDPLLARVLVEGMNVFIPGNWQMIAFAPQTSTSSPFLFSRHLSAKFFRRCVRSLAGRLWERHEAMRANTLRFTDEIRGDLTDDYYALLPQPKDLETRSG